MQCAALSGAMDLNGFSMHAKAGHGGTIPLNTWTRTRGHVGPWLNGKTVDRIQVSYDRPAGRRTAGGTSTGGTLP
jgi:hypothetical protein